MYDMSTVERSISPQAPKSPFWFSPRWKRRERRFRNPLDNRVEHLALFVIFVIGFSLGTFTNTKEWDSGSSGHTAGDAPEYAFASVAFGNANAATRRKNLEHNDAMLREAGFPGLTVFSEGDNDLSSLNVLKLVPLPALSSKCKKASDKVTCYKLSLLDNKAFWEVSTRYLMFIDSDAEILDSAFVHHAAQHSDFSVDFAAVPTLSRWGSAGMVVGPPFDDSAYFLRISVFRTPAFVEMVREKLEQVASSKAQKTEEGIFNQFLTANPSVRHQVFPWRMNCMGEFIKDGCWLKASRAKAD